MCAVDRNSARWMFPSLLPRFQDEEMNTKREERKRGRERVRVRKRETEIEREKEESERE